MYGKRFYINSQGSDKTTFQRALQWLLEKSSSSGGGFLAVPLLGNIDGIITSVIGEGAVRELKKNHNFIISGIKIGLITEKLMQHNLGNKPILVAYPPQKFLDELDSINGISEMLVIPWSLEEVKSWIKTRKANELGTEIKTEEQHIIKNPVVLKAVEYLTSVVNLSTGISHPSDKAATIDTFRILKQNHEDYDVDEINSWLIIKGGWKANDASDVIKIAKGIQEGKSFRTTHRGPFFKSTVIDTWRKEAGVEIKNKSNESEIALIPRKPVVSSNIQSIGYDEKTRILDIGFIGGRVYRYFDVPEELHLALMQASSHGKFFAAYIRGRFNDTQIQ